MKKLNILIIYDLIIIALFSLAAMGIVILSLWARSICGSCVLANFGPLIGIFFSLLFIGLLRFLNHSIHKKKFVLKWYWFALCLIAALVIFVIVSISAIIIADNFLSPSIGI
ncbi:MAG TPA: hypothetical protein P5323_01180 [Candidatus Moranbacteria bacterium]|nr:hypothetical protein [Candidatus Moranbacteria bacterium]HRY27726.1 hypothetical protein [Candidatus Moranbacteria bacterium]HSA08523.1 hypothetical protein [Candidatus Moranbacteria bacterium]